MEEQEYVTMAQVEAEHWWYKGLHDCLLNFIPSNHAKLLDVGCGTGQFLKLLNDANAVGLDFSEQALDLASAKVANSLVKGDIRDLPFGDETFDTIVSCDVLDCFDDEEERRQALGELYRVMSRDGLLLLNLPAFPILKSSHDKAVHVVHRFRKEELKNLLLAEGFEIQLLSYRNCFLFPLAAMLRLIRKKSRRGAMKSDVELPHKWLNKLLSQVLYLENSYLSMKGTFPFGLSLFALVKKV
ncbi:class I SAM-dependent methyltransferase [Lentisphaera profundi]|uniref:Class I SAM-dependent methyltransferase n=1 Tax=Lentisphaera profundi TaxID=1658616 RepID=A0ABY7VV23_9BACT|nr:class I SAM-dependent methyltransferase [Lentisphaera profundi]WDE95953.1 class I SAM-dependent methyltransferase [Lentisphaera profundi]